MNKHNESSVEAQESAVLTPPAWLPRTPEEWAAFYEKLNLEVYEECLELLPEAVALWDGAWEAPVIPPPTVRIRTCDSETVPPRHREGIEVTVVENVGGNNVSKRITLQDGKPKSDASACKVWEGTLSRFPVPTLKEFANLIGTMRSDQAIILGRLDKRHGPNVKLFTEKNPRSKDPGCAARTKDNLSYAPGSPALLLIDVDFKGIGAEQFAKFKATGGIDKVLSSIIPGFEYVARVRRLSTSAGLINVNTGERYEGSGGEHNFILVKDGADAERFLKTLHDLCWLHGFGWMWLNKRGNPLDRSIIDISVSGGERLVFEGKAVIDPALRQEEREPEVFDSEVFDTSTVTISIEEQLRVLEMKEGAKTSIKGEASKIRAKFEKEWIAGGGTKRDLEQLDNGYLLPSASLTFEKFGVAKVADVLANPDKFHEHACADPVEGVPYGSNTAMVLKGHNDGEVFVNSFAHGGCTYQLRHNATSIQARLDATTDVEEVKRIFAALLPYAVIDGIERSALIKLVAQKCGCSTSDVKEFLKGKKKPPKDEWIRNQRWGFIISNSPQNVRLAIEKLGIRCRHNEFSYLDIVGGVDGFPEQELNDKMVARVVFTIDKLFGFLPENKLVDMVLTDIAWNNRYHPVRDYLRSLRWDGEKRLDTWLIKFAGAKDTPLNRAIGAIWLTAGVRRVLQPGCKFDTIPVFEASQGKNKSQALGILARKPEWFCDDVPFDMSTKEIIEKTSGKWIIEFSEMSGHGKRDVDHVKSFLSRQTDKARMAFERRSEEKKRQWIEAGSINRTQYLLDDENRRYWPVAIVQFDLEALKRDADQLWAEAVEREALDEPITLPETLWPEAAEAQAERRIVNPLTIKLTPYFGEAAGDLWVKTYEVWNVLGFDTSDTMRNSKAAGEAMQELGFAHKRPRGGKDRHGNSLRNVYLYTRGENPREWIDPNSDEAKDAAEATDAAAAAVRRAEEAAKGQNHKFKGKYPF